MPDGIHACTRKSNSKHYKDITSIVALGANIGATANTYPYFMHGFTQGGAIDSGIFFKDGKWYVFTSGKIDEPAGWKSQEITNVSKGGTVTITSHVSASSNSFETIVTSGGKTVKFPAKLSSERASSLRTDGSEVCREMNIASHLSNLNNEDAYFSDTVFKESTIVNVGNFPERMTTGNTSMVAKYYDNPAVSHPNVKRSEPPVTSTVNGCVVDSCWCRCNM